MTSKALEDQARRVLRLIPRLHRWATLTLQVGRVSQELSLRQLGLLFLVREGMSSPRELARRLRVTPAVVTGLLDRLEGRGYARRVDAPDDRRRLRVTLTESGLEISRRVDQVLAEGLAAEFSGAPASELASLGVALGVLERAVGTLEARAGALDPEDPDLEWDGGASAERARKKASPARRARARAGAAGRKAGLGGARRQLQSDT